MNLCWYGNIGKSKMYILWQRGISYWKIFCLCYQERNLLNWDSWDCSHKNSQSKHPHSLECNRMGWLHVSLQCVWRHLKSPVNLVSVGVAFVFSELNLPEFHNPMFIVANNTYILMCFIEKHERIQVVSWFRIYIETRNELCFRPRFCTCKAILRRGQPELMRWILLWIMLLVQDQSLDLLTSSPARYHCAMDAPDMHWENSTCVSNS